MCGDFGDVAGGDGVADDADKCANTPAGVQVDADGCPLDDDKDGVANYLKTAHEELCLIVQVESRLGVENVAAIAAVEGFDG